MLPPPEIGYTLAYLAGIGSGYWIVAFLTPHLKSKAAA